MPVLAAALPWIVAGTAAASTGISAYQMNDSRINQDAAASQNAEALKNSEQAQANQTALSQKNAVTALRGQAQAQTGGSLTDQGFEDFAASLAGLPGYSGGTRPATGQSSTPQASQQPDIQSILSQLQGSSNISGGGATQPDVSQNGLSSPVV